MYFYMNDLKNVTFTIVSRRMKFFIIKLTTVAQALCIENYKASLKDLN